MYNRIFAVEKKLTHYELNTHQFKKFLFYSLTCSFNYLLSACTVPGDTEGGHYCFCS